MSFDSTPPMTPGALRGGAPDVGTSPIEVVRHEERLRAGAERLAAGTVRIAKRVVTEERTVTVTVRREELVVEHLPAPTGAAGTGAAGTGAAGTGDRSGGPVVTLTLSEEVPEVVLRVVPRERVHVYVDRLTSDQAVTAEVAREVVEHDVVGLRDDTSRAADR